ncbi:MAG: NAD(P)/FAD-dependent oxidoreductase [Paracoccaceae bacterium]
MTAAAPRDHATAAAPDILIVGAGFSGLAMAMEARKRGFEDVIILEKADELGGTWRDNTYPGVACDIPSHLYSFADHPKPDWSRAYAQGPEIQRYLLAVAEAAELRPLIRFGRSFRRAAWHDAARRWNVETEAGETFRPRVLVSALGALHVPATPSLPGLGAFAGPVFHSARWRHDVPLAGKRVAVVGTGASAVQFVPEIAKLAAEVTVFQRTPPYVVPRHDGPIAPWVRSLYRALPILPAIRRRVIHAVHEAQHAVFRGEPLAVRLALSQWRRNMERHVHDPAMRSALTPDYRIGCKRILSSNDWYPALARPNVRLIPEGVAAIRPDAVVAASGREAPADVLIFATGFHVTDTLGALDIRGAGGRSLAETWAGGIRAHLGTAVAGFPNLFLLLGPNTGLGHNSVVLMIEAQAAHVARLLAQMRAAGLDAVAPRPEAEAAFAEEMRERLDASVWQAGGCRSWYQDAAGGNPTLWPGTVGEFQRRLAGADLSQYRPAPIRETAP